MPNWQVLVGRCCFLYMLYWLGHKMQGHVRIQSYCEDGVGIHDAIMEWFQPWNAYIRRPKSRRLQHALMLFATVNVDLILMALWGSFIFFGFTRFFVLFLVQMLIRQLLVCHFHLPVPNNIVWSRPFGLPSVFIDYEMKHDLFFSGHVSLCCLATEFLAEQFGYIGLGIGLFLLCYNILFLYVFRVHWTADIYAAMTTSTTFYLASLLVLQRY